MSSQDNKPLGCEVNVEQLAKLENDRQQTEEDTCGKVSKETALFNYCTEPVQLKWFTDTADTNTTSITGTLWQNNSLKTNIQFY